MNYSFDFKIYKMSDDKEFNHLVGLEKKVLKWKRTARPRRWLWNARVNDQILSSGSEDGFQEPGDQEPERAPVVPPPVQADDFDISLPCQRMKLPQLPLAGNGRSGGIIIDITVHYGYMARKLFK